MVAALLCALRSLPENVNNLKHVGKKVQRKLWLGLLKRLKEI